MTAADRARLRELAEAATPGPWPAMTWYGSEDGGHAAIGPHHVAQDEEDDGYNNGREDDAPGGPVEDRAMRDAAFIADANPTAVLALLDALDRAEAERDGSIAEVERLKAEAVSVDNSLAEAAAHWEALIASAGQFCGHCRTPVPLDEMRTHIRACPSNPMVADLAARDATIAELRGLLVEARCHLSANTAGLRENAVRRLADRIDAALGGKERG